MIVMQICCHSQDSQIERHSHVKIDEFDENFLQVVRHTIATKWWYSESRFRRSGIKCLCESLTKIFRHTTATKWWHSESRSRRNEIKCLCENLTKIFFRLFAMQSWLNDVVLDLDSVHMTLNFSLRIWWKLDADSMQTLRDTIMTRYCHAFSRISLNIYRLHL